MAPNAPGHPRLVASSEAYELVAILEGERLTIYLDRFEDNAPVTDAAITVTIDDETVVAAPAADGSYAVASKRFASGGLAELVFDVRRPGADDLLIGKMSLRNASSAGHPSELTASPVQWWSYLRHGAEDHFILMSLILTSTRTGAWSGTAAPALCLITRRRVADSSARNVRTCGSRP
jgi:hypothetical protein